MERHDHPAAPEQVDEGFETGADHKPDPPEEDLEPNFARGIAHEGRLPEEHRGRFSEGEEKLPDSPEKHREGRFSTGNEDLPKRDDD